MIKIFYIRVSRRRNQQMPPDLFMTPLSLLSEVMVIENFRESVMTKLGYGMIGPKFVNAEVGIY